MRRAGFGIRLGAAAIDLVVMYFLQIIAGMIVGLLLFANRAAQPAPPSTFLLWVSGVGATTTFLYSLLLFELFGSASPAKRLLKLRIAGADELPAPLVRRAVRWAIKYSPLLLYFAATVITYRWALQAGGSTGPPPTAMLLLNALAGLGGLAVVGGFFTTLGARRQALHDLVAGTVVLRPDEQPHGFAPVMPIAGPVVPPPMPQGAPDGR